MVGVRATILQEDEEKVVVEETFNPKGFPEKEGEGTSGSSDGSEPASGFEKWVIKSEQSINIFLTVSIASL